METYLVYLDIKPDSSSLDEICEFLNNHKGIRFQPFGWIISTDDTAESVCTKLRYMCGRDDYFVLTTIDDSCCFKQPECITRWLNANIKGEL